jgi:glycosyltransferase involved in cell wall biosynthesis
VGRLSPEKGIETLLEAWKRIGKRLPLKIVGDGPMASEVEEQLASRIGIEWKGAIQREEVIRYMKEAELLVFPSVWIEGFPMTMVEAFAVGLPVIASRLGAMAGIIEDGRTGLHFESGNPKDLASKVEWAWAHPDEMEEMGREARKEYKKKYTAEINYKMLIDIYKTAIKRTRMKK